MFAAARTPTQTTIKANVVVTDGFAAVFCVVDDVVADITTRNTFCMYKVFVALVILVAAQKRGSGHRLFFGHSLRTQFERALAEKTCIFFVCENPVYADFNKDHIRTENVVVGSAMAVREAPIEYIRFRTVSANAAEPFKVHGDAAVAPSGRAYFARA